MSNANSVEGVFTRSDKTPYANLLIISGCLEHLLTSFMSFHTTLVDTKHSFLLEGFWNLDGNRSL